MKKDKLIYGAVMAITVMSVTAGVLSMISDSKYEPDNIVELDKAETEEYSEKYQWITESVEDINESIVGRELGANIEKEGIYNRNEAPTEMTEVSNEATEKVAQVDGPVKVEVLDNYSFDEDSSLLWPIEGNIIMGYSMDSTILHKTLGIYKVNPAINIQAEVGSNVGAAADGLVQAVYTSEETGMTITVAIGDGYVATYGLLKDVILKPGDTVAAGQLIGTVAAPSAYYIEEGPNVYFSLTKDGEYIDPLKFMKQ